MPKNDDVKRGRELLEEAPKNAEKSLTPLFIETEIVLRQNLQGLFRGREDYGKTVPCLVSLSSRFCRS